MDLMKTDKEVLTDKEILAYIDDYETSVVPEMDKLWNYYIGNDTNILSKKQIDPSNPSNKIPIPYGRKIITTFTGYAYRPKYITYKPVKKLTKDDLDILNYDTNSNPDGYTPEQFDELYKSAEESSLGAESIQSFYDGLAKTFSENNEPLKTSRAGRNTGIFGVSYELLYIDSAINPGNRKIPVEAKVRFFPVDPREMILLYDFSSEPKKKIAIRFYRISKTGYKVEVYYKDKIQVWNRILNDSSDLSNRNGILNGEKWKMELVDEAPNYFDDIPVVAYYFGDDMEGLIRPVVPLIDAYDSLVSDSMDEFDRFANAYLIMKKTGITTPEDKKSPGRFSQALKFLKNVRVFENLPSDADIHFLTKDIPTAFVDFMSKFLENQIHIQSHVPDFAGEKFSGASGIAIERLLFDFENVCSSAEADFDIGLYDRIRLISIIYKKLNLPTSDPGDISISHKRNIPLNLQEFAQTALTMKSAGFSKYLIADIMPDDIVPDVDEELKRQKEELDEMIPDVGEYSSPEGNPQDTSQNNPQETGEE